MHEKIVLKIKKKGNISKWHSSEKRTGWFSPFSFTSLIMAHENIKIFSLNFKQRQEEAVSVIAS